MENEIKETSIFNEEIENIEEPIGEEENQEQTSNEEDLTETQEQSDKETEENPEENNEDENPENTEDEEPVIEEAPKIPEPDGYVYFDENKSAKIQPIENYICRIPLNVWQEFCTLSLGKDYDIIDGEFTDLRLTDEYISEKLEIKRAEKVAENITKAKQAVEKGYVIFKDAQFETNSQTVGDLTATMLMLQAQQNVILSVSEESSCHSEGVERPKNDDNISYTWLSKDDKAVELTLEDFITLGNLIAEFKNTIWSNKYIAFKLAIEQAQTLEELEGIEINYGNFDV